MAASRNPIQVTVRIAFFQDKPQNLPASNYMVLLSAIAALLSTAFLEVSVPISNNFELAFLQLVVYGVAVAALLYFSRRIARWRQTISALFGTNCVVRCLAYFPMVLATDFANQSESFFWLAAVAIPFGIWGLCITAFIFREAMEISNGKAFFLALGVNLAVSLIVLQLFGEVVDPVTESIQ